MFSSFVQNKRLNIGFTLIEMSIVLLLLAWLLQALQGEEA